MKVIDSRNFLSNHINIVVIGGIYSYL